MLIEAGVSLKGSEFLGSHHNVALGVLAGDFDAGALKEDVFEAYEGRGLRAIAWTPSVSDHVFVSGGKLKPDDLKAVRWALFRLKDSAEGIAVLNSIQEGVTGLVPASDADYDSLRGILKTLDKAGVSR
jgi:phosphonate transport system substrate-binding protein